MKKKILTYSGIILGFIILSYAYNPQLFRGKIVNQSDISSWEGMAGEILKYNKEHPDDKTLWTNSMFSGMPATSIHVEHEGDYTEPLYKFLYTGMRPASYLLISLIGGFLLFLAFGANVWIAVAGAIAVTFCSYNMQIIQVGHNSKMAAIAFMPWVVAAVIYAYRKNSLWGALFFAFALSFQIKANHPQITYYLAIIIFGYAIAQMCGAIKEKYFKKFLLTSILLLVAGILGIATNSTRLIPTYEYAKYTMRGGSELKKDPQAKAEEGLDIQYATAWSYGIGETPNLMIPDFNGGSSHGSLGRDSRTYQVLKSKYQGADNIIKQMPLYWGPQPFTAGPMYLGAVCVFLFVLGLCIIRGRYKWWIVGVSLIALFLAWGSHFMWFTELFFKYVPLYNKFRTVSMALVVLQITVPILGVLAVKEILQGDRENPLRIKKGFYIALGATAGVSLLFAIFPSLAGNFTSSADGNLPADIASALADDRRSLLRADAFRSFIFIILCAGVLWIGWMRKIKMPLCAGLIGVLILADLWTIDKRYLNDSHFVRKQEYKALFNKRPVDEMILKDTNPYYRVLDLSVNTFNDAYISYHHKTIGGYSPAKLQRYQDLIEYYIAPEMSSLTNEINSALPEAKSIGDIETALSPHPVLSMLNTKYIIISGDNPPIEYRYRNGNCWVVNDILWASNPNMEIESIAKIDPASTVILSSEDSATGESGLSADMETFGAKNISADNGSIFLTEYAPNRLRYSSSSSTPSIAIFSEIYYPAGWKAYIDGVETPIMRADYALRSIVLPEGEHNIEMVFSPDSFKIGANISRASSILLYLLLIGMGGWLIYDRRKSTKSA
jgi:hypothetical protein